MRPFSRFVLLIVLMAAAMLPALAAPDSDIEVIRFVRVPTLGPVVLNAVVGAGQSVDSFRDLGAVTGACASFTNTDARVAKTVRVQFVYFNASGDRADGMLLTRNGTFSAGVRERAVNPNRRVNRDDCIPLHPPRGGFLRHRRLHRAGGFQRWFDVVGKRRAHGESRRSGIAELGLRLHRSGRARKPDRRFRRSRGDRRIAAGRGGNVRCVRLRSHRRRGTCSSARSRERPAPGNLFAIHDASVCVPSGNAAHDDEAVQLVEQQKIAIREPQVFRVYFPALSTSPAVQR